MVEDLAGQPIAWTRSGDGEFPYLATHGGARLTIRVNDFPAEPLYTLLVDDRPALDLEDWPACWQRPAVPDAVLHVAAAEQTRRGRVDALVLADWARRLCVIPAGPTATILAALGLTGALADAIGYRLLTPPPAGTGRVEVSEEDGTLTALRVTPMPAGPGRDELDELLGAGRDGVRIHWDQPRPVHYDVTVAAAPFGCQVTAYFPIDAVLSATVLMQRRPVRLSS